ncbi:MAG: homocysteine S-methyltransferase family protein [Thermoanaerobaculia bacterium]|nr:homocysteine S-methyltransferase family protein [Thermoanaerobaculia bacterium]
MSAALFRERLLSGPPLVLDAALGTDLLRRGARLPAPLWSAQALLDAPDLVATIHRENAEAGADVLTIASFRLHGRNVRESSCSLSQGELLAIAVDTARRATNEEEISRPSSSATRPSQKVFNDISIAGSLAPLGDCYRPDRVPSEAEISSEHHEMAHELARAGVDLVLVETMNTVREAVAAACGASATGLPVVVSCVSDGAGRLLSGERVEDFARALLALPSPPAALGVNCVAARALGADLARLAAAAPGVPLAAYGNTYGDPVAPEDYAALATEWLGLGARLVGGCCGTRAAHTAALRARLG